MFPNARIILAKDGRYYVQVDLGFIFRKWFFLEWGAHESPWTLMEYLVTRDPAKAAHFYTKAEAQDCLWRTRHKVLNAQGKAAQAQARARKGLDGIMVIKED